MKRLFTFFMPYMIFFPLFAVFACRSTAGVPISTQMGQRPNVQANSLEQKIHHLINRERRRHDLPEVAWNERLAAIARKHSRDMGMRGYFSHNSPEGLNFPDRYKLSGFSCSVSAGGYVYLGAENIFQNNMFDSVTTINGKAFHDWNTEEKIAESTVRGWMNSPGHRKNILTPIWQTEGIGVFISQDGKIYITQNFC